MYFCKTFDKVPHQCLLLKLQQTGLEGSILLLVVVVVVVVVVLLLLLLLLLFIFLGWIECFVIQRSQRVYIDGVI